HRKKCVKLKKRVSLAVIRADQRLNRFQDQVRLCCKFGNTLCCLACRKAKPVHQLVVFLVVKCKAPVGIGHGLKLPRRIRKLIPSHLQLCVEKAKTAGGKLLQNRLLILEVIIYYRNGVLNSIRDLADGKGLPSYGARNPPG